MPFRMKKMKKGMAFKSTMNLAYARDDLGTDKASQVNIIRVTEKIKTSFPGAFTSHALAEKVSSILTDEGYDDKKTLFATSLCCDEVNRDLEDDFRKIYGSNFSMGGLAGFPFGGVTSFGAMSHHIPDKGSCIVMYGPHVGIDYDGNVGKVNRRGRPGSGACCGSANAAAAYVKQIRAGEREQLENPEDILDAQQTWVGAQLIPYGERLENAVDADIELPLAFFDAQDNLMLRIVERGCGEVAGNGMIALLGGVQINTPEHTGEYFLPKRFEIRNNKGEMVADLLPRLQQLAGEVPRRGRRH